MNGLVQVEDFRSQSNGAFSDLEKLVDGAYKLLVIVSANVLDILLSLCSQTSKSTRDVAAAVSGTKILDDRYELIDVVRV